MELDNIPKGKLYARCRPFNPGKKWTARDWAEYKTPLSTFVDRITRLTDYSRELVINLIKNGGVISVGTTDYKYVKEGNSPW